VNPQAIAVLKHRDKRSAKILGGHDDLGVVIERVTDDELAVILAGDPLVFAAAAPVTTAVESMPTATADAIRAILLGP
jgi:hypothetical protein